MPSIHPLEYRVNHQHCLHPFETDGGDVARNVVDPRAILRPALIEIPIGVVITVIVSIIARSYLVLAAGLLLFFVGGVSYWIGSRFASRFLRTLKFDRTIGRVEAFDAFGERTTTSRPSLSSFAPGSGPRESGSAWPPPERTRSSLWRTMAPRASASSRPATKTACTASPRTWPNSSAWSWRSGSKSVNRDRNCKGLCSIRRSRALRCNTAPCTFTGRTARLRLCSEIQVVQKNNRHARGVPVGDL